MAARKSGSTLKAIQEQIAALQAKAAEIRQQEVGGVIAKIKDAIAHYGLTAADLGLAAAAPKAATATKTSKPGRKLGRKSGGRPGGSARTGKPVRAAKYIDGQGNTWSGLGKRPNWFKAALAAGKKAEEMLVKS
jgi:DNA-binding protein H-NS